MKLLFKKSAPNAITVLRLIAVIPLIHFTPAHPWIALFIFIPSVLSDALDGWLARRWQTQTDLGARLDPIADKILYLGMLFRLKDTALQIAWILMVTALIEFMLVAIRFWPLNSLLFASIPATDFGKTKMALQSTAISVMLLGLAFQHPDTLMIGVGMAAAAILLSWKSLMSHFNR